MEPLASIDASRSALPGPMAISWPRYRRTRIRRVGLAAPVPARFVRAVAPDLPLDAPRTFRDRGVRAIACLLHLHSAEDETVGAPSAHVEILDRPRGALPHRRRAVGILGFVDQIAVVVESGPVIAPVFTTTAGGDGARILDVDVHPGVVRRLHAL